MTHQFAGVIEDMACCRHGTDIGRTAINGRVVLFNHQVKLYFVKGGAKAVWTMLELDSEQHKQVWFYFDIVIDSPNEMIIHSII